MSRFLDVAFAVGRRNITNWLKNPAFFLPSLMFPLFFLVAFAGGLSSIGDVPGFDYGPGYTAFEFVFVVLQASAFGGVFSGFGVAADFENGFGRRLLLAAPNRLGILAGYWLSALFRATVTSLLLFFVATVIGGMDIDGGIGDLLALYVLGLLMATVAMLFASGVALRARTIQAGPAMQMPVFLLLFLAPVYVPRELLAGWIKTVADVNPLTPIIEAGRDLVAGLSPNAGLAYGVAVGGAVLMLAWAVRGLRSAERAGG